MRESPDPDTLNSFNLEVPNSPSYIWTRTSNPKKKKNTKVLITDCDI